MSKSLHIRKLVGVGLVFFAASGLTAVDTDTARLIQKKISQIEPEIIRIRRFIHMNPELGNREFETAKLIASKLLALGLDVETGVAHTGVVGVLHGDLPGETVAVRADMDALPIQELTSVSFKSLNTGIMHACGHDMHTAIVLGTAYVLSSMKARIKGRIKFIFQPAEEGSPTGEEGGASLMIKEGVLQNPDVKAIFGLHVWPEDVGQILFAPGAVMAASDGFSVTVKGKSAHGARPHEGIDAVAISAHIIVNIHSMISRFTDATDPSVVSVGTINGGSRSNIIADSVSFEGTIRTLSEKNRNKIRLLIEDIVRGTTRTYGAEYEFVYRKGTPPLYNHPELAKILEPTIHSVLGSENVLPLQAQMVSEDFASYGLQIPGFYFFLGVKNPAKTTTPPLHSPYFNPDERAIPIGIKILSHILLDSLDYQSRSHRDLF